VAFDREALEGRWVHAYEEDTSDELVFRPASHPLPPSRGRESFELRGDGTLVERAPGPADAPVEATGTWELRGDKLVLRGSRGERALRVASVRRDRLAVRR
jgi:hypothetical protein